MTKMKILVMTDHMPWGHRSIAKAIYGYLEKRKEKNNLEVEYREVRIEDFDLFNDIYTNIIYRFFPRMGVLAPRIANINALRQFVNDNIYLFLPNLLKKLKDVDADLVISSHFALSWAMADLREKKGFDMNIWTVAADPWTNNPISFVPKADKILVYDDVAVKQGVELGIEPEKLFKTGWWVREEMYKKYNREVARKKLGFTDDRPVIFVGGGSLGTTAVTKVLPVLMMVKKKVGLVFNAGTDKFSYNLVEEYKKILKRIRKNEIVEIKNFGWLENIAEVIAGCDMVLGKAGPNFLFDCVALKKPFVSITHIGGQEDGNIDLILKKKLGWTKEKPGEAGNFLLDYLENPKRIEKKYRKTIELEAERNSKSLERIFVEIKKLRN